MQDRIYNMLMQKDEITWQSIIYDLVRTGEMDPWDIDISILSKRYLEALKTLKEAHFLISGKIVLAAAILLKIKSDKLLTEKIANLDSQLFSQGEIEDLSFEDNLEKIRLVENPKLTIKTPLARKRKVSLNDLMGALQRALEVDKRRTLKKIREEEHLAKVKMPEKKIDISLLIKNLYDRIIDFFGKKETLTFTELVDSDKKEDKIKTFVPLLHLVNNGKISVEQKEHFGEIDIIKL
ncbi:segregation/condensation protein A [Candidatus Woesearchaeota archaeon]|nr:segregation/condensation protein A [Candidatus Woesearchaeota archaeon]